MNLNGLEDDKEEELNSLEEEEFEEDDFYYTTKVVNKPKPFKEYLKEVYQNFGRSCHNCINADPQGTYCNLFKEVIYDPELDAFSCKKYTKDIHQVD